jgi:hypothetical protein
MKPDAIYYFIHTSEYRTRCLQIGHIGRITSEFPSVTSSSTPQFLTIQED